jgi:uncharacterized protein YecE (DUF72 family)
MGHGSPGSGRTYLSPVLPYHLGCPSWSDTAWRGGIYPRDARPESFLRWYCQTFNAVEGNTTFYARPSPTVVERWAQTMPVDFRFTAKFPRDISHAGDLRLQVDAARDFAQSLAILGPRVAPFWLQLPAAFAPHRLGELAFFIESFGLPLAVEVRHPGFFARGDEERALNRLLLGQGIERICLDSRPLFSCHSDDPAVLAAQAKKPRVPPRPVAFTDAPQVRFIGGPDLQANDAFLAQWVAKVAGWIEEGRTPYVFLHTPDNHLAAEQALRFHQQLTERLPGLAPLDVVEHDEPAAQQLGLL